MVTFVQSDWRPLQDAEVVVERQEPLWKRSFSRLRERVASLVTSHRQPERLSVCVVQGYSTASASFAALASFAASASFTHSV